MTSASQSFQNIDSLLGGIAAADTATGATPSGGQGGGHFVLEPDQISAIVADWQDLASQYEASLSYAADLAGVIAPGKEIASDSHAQTANMSGQAYLKSLEEKWDYCLSQADKFQKALDDYLGVEHETITRFTNSTSHPPVQGGKTENRGGF